MDYLGPFQQSKCGKWWILLVIDSFSGWCEAFVLPNADAMTTAKALYSKIFTRYGSPWYLLSDRGANFLSTLVQALCYIFSIKRVCTSSYHQASNSKYKLGDIMWLHDPTTSVSYSRKLKPRWRGPYRISNIDLNSSYRLHHYSTDIPTDTLINVQQIKPAHLPWESRISRENLECQVQRDLLRRNPALAPPHTTQQKPTAAQQQWNNSATSTQIAKQHNSSRKTTNRNQVKASIKTQQVRYQSQQHLTVSSNRTLHCK